MHRPIFSSNSKSIEWLMSFFMLGWAVTLVLPGDTLTLGVYIAFRKLGLTDQNLTITFLAISFIRIGTLAMNGSIKKGPEVRFICSMFGAFIWMFTAVLLVMPYINGTTKALPVSCMHHMVMFFGEIYAVGVASVERRIRLR